MMGETIQVLHVDDEPDFADLAATFLEREHDQFDVVTATSVSEGSDVLSETDIDCIVSDYDMPGENGLEFLRTVRDSHPDLPFILYTGKGSEEIAGEAITAGVTEYLEKETGTSQYTVLANRIRNAVEQRRAEQSVTASEEKLRLLAEKTDDVLFMFDGDWEELLFINPAYEDMWGGSISELRSNPDNFLTNIHPDDRDIAKQSMERLSDGHPDEVEYRVISDTDDQRWVRGESKPVLDEDGSVSRIVGYVRDVTEEKERQQELERIKRRYDAIFHDPNILVGVLTPDGRVRDINETAMEYVDTDLDDIRNDPFWETPWWGSDDALQAEVKDWVEQAAGGEYVEFEADITGPEEDRTVRGVFRPVTTADGEVESIVVSDRDITERKTHERELERLWDRVEFLLEVTNSGIWEWDLDRDEFARHGIHRLFDLPEPEAEAGHGIDREGSLSVEDFLDRIHPDDRQEVEASLSRLRSGTDSHRIEYRVLPDGDTAADDPAVRWLEDRAHVRPDSENPTEVVGLVTDVTDRKQREQAIQALHATAQNLWTAETPEAVAEIVVDAARDILDMPANAIHLYDDEDDCLRPVAATDRVTDFIGEIPAFHRGEGLAWEVFETGNAHVHDDVSDHPDRYNEETPVRSEMILPLGEYGVFMVGSPETARFDETDVSLMQTLSAHAANALAQIERERRLTALQERVQTLMHTPTTEATAEAAVEAAHEILGSPSCGVHAVDDDGDGLVPVAYVDTIRTDFDAPIYDRREEDNLISTLVWDAYQEKETIVLDDTRECEGLAEASPVRSAIIHPLGDYGVFLVTAAQPDAFEGADKTFIEILATSLTTALERVERETNLQARDRDLQRQNERLDEFASLVSHDLRNPLNVAQGRVELAQEDCDSEHLAIAASALERSQRLVDDVLTLAREGETVGALEAVHLPRLIEDCWTMVETDDASLQIDTDRTIKADQSRLRQLLENVIHNAIEHGGDDVTVTIGDLPGGFYIADDGPGVPEDVRDDVFEAGYSTSDDGTGFGLNIVREIATAHGWSVDITDSDAGGARFEITGVEHA